ncbi:MAG: hypothetical protein M3R22_06000 [Pseudomonadota bacterium]|nr:hypothetical protein [Pseudomonadota bacterium]
MRTLTRIAVAMTAVVSCAAFAQTDSAADQARRQRNVDEVLARHHVDLDRMNDSQSMMEHRTMRSRTHHVAQATRSHLHEAVTNMRADLHATGAEIRSDSHDAAEGARDSTHTIAQKTRHATHRAADEVRDKNDKSDKN